MPISQNIYIWRIWIWKLRVGWQWSKWTAGKWDATLPSYTFPNCLSILLLASNSKKKPQTKRRSTKHTLWCLFSSHHRSCLITGVTVEVLCSLETFHSWVHIWHWQCLLNFLLTLVFPSTQTYILISLRKHRKECRNLLPDFINHTYVLTDAVKCG